jgi:hypothetical protein
MPSFLHLGPHQCLIFADDTSVIISGKTLDDSCMLLNKAISQMSKWFSANNLSPNLDKTNVIKCITKNSSQYPLNIEYSAKYIEDGVNTKLLVCMYICTIIYIYIYFFFI